MSGNRGWHKKQNTYSLNSSRLHQVGTVLLCTLGRGIGRRSLINKVEWLRGEARCKFLWYASASLFASFGNVRCVDLVIFRHFQVIRSGGHMQTWQHFQFKCKESLFALLTSQKSSHHKSDQSGISPEYVLCWGLDICNWSSSHHLGGTLRFPKSSEQLQQNRTSNCSNQCSKARCSSTFKGKQLAYVGVSKFAASNR